MTHGSDLRAFLLSLDVETLVDFLCERADRDEELRRRLLALGGDGESSPEPPDESAQDDTVQFDSVLDTVQRLLDAGTSADVTPLARRTADRLVMAVRESDEPPAGLVDQLERAVSLYARACVAHPPPWHELAEWLADLAFDGPDGVEVCLTDFAEALGAEGVEWIRSVVDAVLAEGDDGRRGHVARALRLQIAEITSDVDTVVSLLSEELPRLDVSLRIVRVLRAAGRHSEAIAHAARALGDATGRNAAPAPVVEALERVRTRQSPVDISEIESLLNEDRCDEAWKAVSRYEPSDVIPLYRDCVERLIDSRNPRQYERAAVQLRRLRVLYRRAGASREFATYLVKLLSRHRRKTRLFDELRRARVALPKALAG